MRKLVTASWVIGHDGRSHVEIPDGAVLIDGNVIADAGGKDAQTISDAVTDTAMELGLSANIVRAGASGGTMRIAPPLTVSDAEIDLGLDLLDTAISRVVEAR